MKVELKVYEGIRYANKRTKIATKVYDIIGYRIISGEEAKQIESETDADGVDEYHEYLELIFADGTVATFRNSHVNLFIY